MDSENSGSDLFKPFQDLRAKFISQGEKDDRLVAPLLYQGMLRMVHERSSGDDKRDRETCLQHMISGKITWDMETETVTYYHEAPSQNARSSRFDEINKQSNEAALIVYASVKPGDIDPIALPNWKVFFDKPTFLSFLKTNPTVWHFAFTVKRFFDTHRLDDKSKNACRKEFGVLGKKLYGQQWTAYKVLEGMEKELGFDPTYEAISYTESTGKKQNEDTVRIDGPAGMMVIGDGVGATSSLGAAKASEIACRVAAEKLGRLGAWPNQKLVCEIMNEAIEKARIEIANTVPDAATTVLMVKTANNDGKRVVAVGHMGNTRGYMVSSKTLKENGKRGPLTKDHDMARYDLDRSVISEEQYLRVQELKDRKAPKKDWGDLYDNYGTPIKQATITKSLNRRREPLEIALYGVPRVPWAVVGYTDGLQVLPNSSLYEIWGDGSNTRAILNQTMRSAREMVDKGAHNDDRTIAAIVDPDSLAKCKLFF